MNSAKINRLIESTEELPLLGYTVSASIAKDLEITHSEYREIVTPLGFGADHLLPPQTQPRTYIRRAMTAWLKELAKEGTANQIIDEDDEEEAGTKKKALVREIKTQRNSPVLILALVQENIDLVQVGLSYLTNLRVFYIKPEKAAPGEPQEPGTLTLTLSARGATDPKTYVPTYDERKLLESLQKHVDKFCQLYKSPELSRMAVSVIESLHAEPMRKGGSVYFVPYSEREGLARLKDLLEVKLHEGVTAAESSRLLHIPIPADPDTTQQIAGVTHDAFVQRIVAFEKRMEKFLSTNQKRGIKADLMMERIGQFDEMRAEMDLYHKLLGMHKDEIGDRLDKLEEQARDLIRLRAIGAKREAAEVSGQAIEEEPEASATSIQ